jgi:heme o synthase
MACSSQAINQVIEAPYDKLMKRTENRPVPCGRISKFQGSCVSFVLGTASMAIFYQYGVSTCLTALGIWGGYVGLYIPLKRTTRFNTHVGALVGSAPVYLGWVAATGGFAGLQPFFMGLYMFSWQFPHFYGILWTYKADFKKAGFNMITNIDLNGKMTYRSALLGNLGQLLACVGLAYTGNINPFFLPFGVISCFSMVSDSLYQFKKV